jgi:hypothetical protein
MRHWTGPFGADLEAVAGLDGYSAHVFPASTRYVAAMESLSGNRRRERIVFETDRHTVVGDVTLPAEGYQARFSDTINREDVGFLPLTDVEITPLAEGDTQKRDFVVLAKAHIHLAYSLGERPE